MRAWMTSVVLVTVGADVGIASTGAKADMLMIAPRAAAHIEIFVIQIPSD
jgi:hypothetical protein